MNNARRLARSSPLLLTLAVPAVAFGALPWVAVAWSCVLLLVAAPRRSKHRPRHLFAAAVAAIAICGLALAVPGVERSWWTAAIGGIVFCAGPALAVWIDTMGRTELADRDYGLRIGTVGVALFVGAMFAQEMAFAVVLDAIAAGCTWVALAHRVRNRGPSVAALPLVAIAILATGRTVVDRLGTETFQRLASGGSIAGLDRAATIVSAVATGLAFAAWAGTWLVCRRLRRGRSWAVWRPTAILLPLAVIATTPALHAVPRRGVVAVIDELGELTVLRNGRIATPSGREVIDPGNDRLIEVIAHPDATFGDLQRATLALRRFDSMLVRAGGDAASSRWPVLGRTFVVPRRFELQREDHHCSPYPDFADVELCDTHYQLVLQPGELAPAFPSTAFLRSTAPAEMPLGAWLAATEEADHGRPALQFVVPDVVLEPGETYAAFDRPVEREGWIPPEALTVAVGVAAATLLASIRRRRVHQAAPQSYRELARR